MRRVALYLTAERNRFQPVRVMIDHSARNIRRTQGAAEVFGAEPLCHPDCFVTLSVAICDGLGLSCRRDPIMHQRNCVLRGVAHRVRLIRGCRGFD
jgi:hypothetical protein